jgi:hypothetical protein
MEEKNIKSSSHFPSRADVYIEMQLNDVMLFSVNHFIAIKELLIENDDLTHIVTKIGFIALNIDKEKLTTDPILEKNRGIELDPYIFANVVAKVDRNIDNYDLMALNIIAQIYDFVKKYIVFH